MQSIRETQKESGLLYGPRPFVTFLSLQIKAPNIYSRLNFCLGTELKNKEKDSTRAAGTTIDDKLEFSQPSSSQLLAPNYLRAS
jgi:hypothetical protein